MGENIWGRENCPTGKRAYGPGQHGPKGVRRRSDYGVQLREKQKLKGYYGNITEKQFKKIFKEAERIKGDTSENLIGLLERRLDAIVYRAKFVPTVFSARQFINHGHVKVNGRRVNIPSYRIKTTDIIEIKDKSRGLEIVLRGTESSERDIPEYIEVDSKKMTAKITKIPNLGEVPYPVAMEPNLVVEFYSRN